MLDCFPAAASGCQSAFLTIAGFPIRGRLGPSVCILPPGFRRSSDRRHAAARARTNRWRFRAERVQHAGDLQGDTQPRRPTATRFDMASSFKEAVGVDAGFRTRNSRMVRPPAVIRMVGGDGLPFASTRWLIHEAREAFDHVDLCLPPARYRRVMGCVDIGGAVGDQLPPVEGVDGGVEAVTGHTDGWPRRSAPRATLTFFGTQPTFTPVPPSSLASISAHFWPYMAARLIDAIPPLPPPIAR